MEDGQFEFGGGELRQRPRRTDEHLLLETLGVHGGPAQRAGMRDRAPPSDPGET